MRSFILLVQRYFLELGHVRRTYNFRDPGPGGMAFHEDTPNVLASV